MVEGVGGAGLGKAVTEGCRRRVRAIRGKRDRETARAALPQRLGRARGVGGDEIEAGNSLALSGLERDAGVVEPVEGTPLRVACRGRAPENAPVIRLGGGKVACCDFN